MISMEACSLHIGEITQDEKDNYFVDVYKFTGDFSEIDIRPQEAETDGFKLATLDEIKEYAEQGIFLHYDSIKKVFE